jgi:hypothetical protein
MFTNNQIVDIITMLVKKFLRRSNEMNFIINGLTLTTLKMNNDTFDHTDMDRLRFFNHNREV